MRVSLRNSPYAPDILLFLILIPFISAVNYYLTYTDIRLNGFLLLTYTIDTLQGYIAWLAVRAVILFLDRIYPYDRSPVLRITIQLVSTTVVGLCTISILTEIVSLIARGKMAPLNFYTIDLIIIGIWFFVINGVYVGLYYYNALRLSEEKRQEDLRLRTEGLLVRHGKQDLRFDFGEIAGFFVEGDYVVASHISGKKYYMDQSLDKFEKTLPGSLFFRLNRQYIVHHQMVTGFRRSENGKLLVLLQGNAHFPSEITVSRSKAPAFKDWFHPG